MKFIVTVKEFKNNSKINEWSAKCDSLAEALRKIKKINESIIHENFTYNYEIAEVL